ncbi:transcriptional regulator ATRX-like [Condylostylus longicornis]|uniref:transcriptional regulator ATRX-like n=1 Tax=Condylostylus longicornis TaxID=2530218 RepID=UPI00244E0042|nr:transcriptional regulator ATRX-like [Condylostylus longicornis]
MCDQIPNISNERNNEFDSKDFYTDTLLDLHVDAPKYSNSNDDEFDLEEIKRAALTNFEDPESTDQINDFPEIDLRVPSESKEKFCDNDQICKEMFKENISYPIDSDISKTTTKCFLSKNIKLNVSNNEISNLNDEEAIQCSTQSFHQVEVKPKSSCNSFSKYNDIDNELKEFVSVNLANKLNYERPKDEHMFNNKDETGNNLDGSWENESIPSPFITSFTPPPFSVTDIVPPFKKEKSVEISDSYFDSDYFEDDNLDNYQQEEICTDEFNDFNDAENCDEIETVASFQNENSNEKIYQHTVEDVIMNDHNYFNQEQMIISVESYMKHFNILNNNLNIFIKNIKNFCKVPELFEKNKTDFEDILEKMNIVRNSYFSIKKSVVAEEVNEFDSALLEALKNVENCNDTSTLNENSKIQIKKENSEEILHEDNKNYVKSLENLKNDLDSNLVKISTDNQNQKVVFKNNINSNEGLQPENGEIVSENISVAKSIQDNEYFSEERPWTKYKALLELAKTIINFSESSNKSEIEEFFEKSKQSICQVISNPYMCDMGIQTEHSGKIYSERRLKSINEKEKRRLLNDSSNSSEDSSESESDNDSSTKYESQSDNNLNKEEQENILNGIDFSKYLDSSNEDSDNFPNDFSEHLDVVLEEEDDMLNKIASESKEIESNSSADKENKARGKLTSPKKINKSTENSGPGSSDNVDKDIERLLDFKSLASQRINNCGYTNADRKSVNKKSITTNISDILIENENKESSDGSETEDEDCVTYENTFLSRQNENLKKQLLESSSNSESDSDSALISPDDDDDENEEFDDSKPTLVEKFLKTYVESECEPEKININPSENHCDDLDQFATKQNAEAIERKTNDNRKTNDVENKENDIPDEDSDKHNVSSDCEFLDKTFISLKQSNKKRKSLDTLLDEDQKRRKNLKISDEIYSLSSDDDESDVEERKTKKTEPHRISRPMMKTEQLTSETKKAQKEEKNRLNRLKKKENILKKAYKEHNKDPSDIRELILDYNTKTKSFVTVHNGLVSHLKQHQIDGVKFMYDCCYGSVNFIEEFPGSGCILAHCMGLGKTLQLITLIHTLIVYKDLKTTRILILCPKSTVMNWAEEIQRWLGPLGVKNMKVFTFNDTSDIPDKMNVLQEWHSCGTSGSHNSGCLLIGYEAFRTLVSYPTKKNRSSRLDLEEIKSVVKKALLDPGADLVVCDEGHIIKNRKAAISQAVTEIKTPRRIVLTGTPIQNNLKEYYSMVNFIKPSFLGTEKEFANLYANPIKNGQHKDSSKREIKIMKQRSFVLHSNLSSFVQRKEAALLKTFLPQKFEYVLFIPMTPVQVKLYEIFLEAVGKREDSEKKGRNLLTDYTCLRKIWTHPKVLENAYNNAILLKNKKEKKSNLEIASDEDQPDDIYDSQTGLMSVTSDWWRKHLTDQDLTSILPSNKLQTMFEILRMCTENREKCLIFSAFVAVLNVVEYYMNLINEKKAETAKELGIERFKGPWVNGKDYYRLDGKTQKTLRHEMVKRFNDPANERARVFLISAKAGGQGINLIGANRVIILDTSWNPSNDQQNIFRIFRLGQKKNCYIYRLISFGTMEEKVYSRSVTKQAMSFRVVDEHQIDRHYSMAELAELYTLTKPDYSNRPIPNLPQDNILAHLLRNFQYVFKYHEHDSLLENKIEQELTEQEKEDAWLAYETEINTPANAAFPNLHGLDIFGNQQLGISGFENFPRSPPSTDIFNQGRAPVPSAQFFPGYNFANKNYLEMFPYFSNANSLYGGIDLTKSTTYADSLNSNFLLPNNRTTGNGLGLTDLPPTSSPSYSTLDNLHIPSSHPNTYNQNLAPYNTLYSSANSLLNSSLNRFNNTSLENFKRVFENYVSSSSNISNMYTSNQNKNQFNSELRAKTTDITNASKNEVNSFRKHNLHPNFTASLATTSSGSMTNSILNAQNRLINQSSNNDLNSSLKTNNSAIVSNLQNDGKTQSNSEASQFDKAVIGSNSHSNTLVHTHLTNASNNQSRSNSKTHFPDNKKTDTIKNVTLDVLKSDNALSNRRSPKTTTNDFDEKSGNKPKQMPIQKTNLAKNLSNQNVQISGFGAKNVTQNDSTIKSQSINTSQANNLSQSSPKVVRRPTNLIKNNGPAKQVISNSIHSEQTNLNTLKGKSSSQTTSDVIISKNIDLQNVSRNKSNSIPLPLSSKNSSTLKKSLPLQFNQDVQKGQSSLSTTVSNFSKTNKFLIDPLSTTVEDKLINAGISISKKSVNSKPIPPATGLTSKQQNQSVPTQVQSGIFQRKRVLNQESSIRGGPNFANKVDSILKKPKLTPKELAEELSSSLKRIQSSKGLTISHKGVTKDARLSADILEVD